MVVKGQKRKRKTIKSLTNQSMDKWRLPISPKGVIKVYWGERERGEREYALK